MRISVAMATYNGSMYIREQLDSLADQTVLPYELVVTDDGSSDETLDIVQGFAEHAPFPVRIHRNPRRLNFADNFLRAASLCQGDWITFCDQDDVWLKDKLEQIVHAASRPGVSMVAHGVKTVDAALRPIAGVAAHCRVRRGNGPQRLPPLGFFAGLCIAFDAALLPLLAHSRFPDAHNNRFEAAHDKWVSTIADAVGTVRYIRKSLTLYRQHEVNTCGAAPRTLKNRWNLVTTAGASTYHDNAALAQRYSEVFHELAASSPDARWRERLEKAARRYERTRDFLLARAALYRATSLPARLYLFARLSVLGQYRFNPMRPPLQAFAKDLCAAWRPLPRRATPPHAPSLREPVPAQEATSVETKS